MLVVWDFIADALPYFFSRVKKIKSKFKTVNRCVSFLQVKKEAGTLHTHSMLCLLKKTNIFTIQNYTEYILYTMSSIKGTISVAVFDLKSRLQKDLSTRHSRYQRSIVQTNTTPYSENVSLRRTLRKRKS